MPLARSQEIRLVEVAKRYRSTTSATDGNVRQREYRATLGFYPDGRLGEVFINAGKSGSDVDIATRDSAIALSFALQYGCAPDDIRAALCRDDHGKAEGPLGTLLDLLTQERGFTAA